MRSFGLVIMRTVFGLVLFVFLVSALLHHDTLESPWRDALDVQRWTGALPCVQVLKQRFYAASGWSA